MKGEGRHALVSFILWSVLSIVEVSTKTVTIHSVGDLRDTGSLQCGSKVTFICSIPTYRYTMKWLIDSDKVAECVTTNCVQYPPYKVDDIEFAPDTSNEEFNMTINPVSLKADGRSIKCSYGSESDQLKLAVKVFPTQETTEIVESKDDSQNMINIIAMTGCVFPNSAISMQWYYYEEGHTPKLYKMSSLTAASNFSACKSGPCGGNGVAKLSSTLSIPEEQNGKDYFFQIAIRHEDTGDIVLVNSTRSYKINEFPSEIVKETDQQVVDTALVIVASSVLSLVIMVLVLKFISKKYSSKVLAVLCTTNPQVHGTDNPETKQSTEMASKEAETTSSADSSGNKFLVDSDDTKEERNNDDCWRKATTEPLVTPNVASKGVG